MLETTLEEGPVEAEQPFPKLRQVVLDCTDARLLAEFYRQLLGFRYRPGDEPPHAGHPDPQAGRWLGLRDPAGQFGVAFQPVPTLPRATWPEGPVPQQLHLDLTVTTKADLDAQHDRALALGARSVAVFVSATESFAKANLNRTMDEALAMSAKIPPAREGSIEVRPVRELDALMGTTLWRCTRT